MFMEKSTEKRENLDERFYLISTKTVTAGDEVHDTKLKFDEQTEEGKSYKKPIVAPLKNRRGQERTIGNNIGNNK